MDHDSRCFLSFIGVREMYAGTHQSTRSGFNAGETRRICAEIPVLEWDFGISDRYGRIQADLRLKGKPIPQNDVWIAATATRHGMTLVTRDRHFSHVDGLPTEFW